MGLPKRLTDIQKRFSELYTYNEGRKTPYECAVEAGYAEDSARVRASELRNPRRYPRRYPLVVKYIGELREEIQQKYEVTFEKHIKELAKIRDEALSKRSYSSAVNAEISRGKAAGLYIEQKIIKTGKLEDMTEAQLEARMKEIIDQYSPILDAKPIEEIKEEVKKLNSPLKHTTQEISEPVEDVHQEDPQKQTDAGKNQERQENEK